MEDFNNASDFVFAVKLMTRMDNSQSERQSDVDDSMTYTLASLLRLRCRSYDNEYDLYKRKYAFLDSLLRYIRHKKNRNRFPDKVIAPVFSKEKETDLLVKDKDFALILGNFTYGTTNKDSQLLNCVKSTIDEGYKEEQIFVIHLTTTDTCNPLDYPEEEWEERYIKLSFREDIIDWMETEVINVMPSIEYSLAKGIYQYYECLIKIFNLDNKQEEHFKVILDTGLQKTRKLGEEKICIFEKRAKTKQKNKFKMIFDTELQKRRKLLKEKICIFEKRAKTLFGVKTESAE